MNAGEIISKLLSMTKDTLEKNNIEYWYSVNTNEKLTSERYWIYKGAAVLYIGYADLLRAELALKKRGEAARVKNILYIYDKNTLHYDFRKSPGNNLGAMYIAVVPLMSLYPEDKISQYFRRIFNILFSMRSKNAFRKNILIKAIALLKNRNFLHGFMYKTFTSYHTGKKDIKNIRYYPINKASSVMNSKGVEKMPSQEVDVDSDEFRIISARTDKAELFRISSPYIGKKAFLAEFPKSKLRAVPRKLKQAALSRILLIPITKARTEIRLTSYLIADRIALYEKYKSRKEYIMGLWRSEEPSYRILFLKEFDEYIKVTNHYISFDKGLCFDYDLFLLMIDYYLDGNQYSKAYRLVKYTPYQHFESCEDYLKPYLDEDDLNNFTTPLKDLSKYKQLKKELLGDIKKFPATKHFNALNEFYSGVGAKYGDIADMHTAGESGMFLTKDTILIDLSFSALNTEDVKKTMGLFKYYAENENMDAAFLISEGLDDILHMLDYDKNDMNAFATTTCFDFTNDAKHISIYIGNNVNMLKHFDDNGIKTFYYDIAHRTDSISAIVKNAIYEELSNR
jgi:hypothetical protein